MRVPCPPNDGATIAMFNLAESLMRAGTEVHVLAFNTSKHFVAEADRPPGFVARTALETVPIDLAVRPAAAFLNLFTRRSYNVERWRSPAFESALAGMLGRTAYDVVQFEGLFLSPYVGTVRRHSRAKVVLRAHNVEHVIWERLAAACANPLKRAYLKLLARRLRRYETATLNRFDAIVPITPVDEEVFRGLGARVPMQTIPVGVDVSSYPPSRPDPGFTVFHLGSMDWMPNLEGVDWFLQHVIPCLEKAVPGVRVVLAGKNMPHRLKAMAGPRLEVLDRIDDARSFMSDKSVMAVPLLSGGGMRVKIVEGMAAGRCIVSTPVGAEGIRYADGLNIRIAATADAFCRAIAGLHDDPEARERIGREARRLAADEYDNGTLGKRLAEFYTKLTG